MLTNLDDLLIASMNTPAVVILLLVIGVTLFISENMAKAKWMPVVLARKIVHIVAVTAVAVSPAFFANQWLLAAIVAGFTGLLCWAVATNKLAIDESRSRKSWGIVLFPIAFLLLLAFFGRSKPWLVIYPMLVLAWADAAAAIVGETFAKRYFSLTGDRKSLVGSATFFITSFLLLWLLPYSLSLFHPVFQWPQPSHFGYTWLVLLTFVAIVAAAAEALGSGGLDNLLVPLFVAWGMEVMILPDGLAGCVMAIVLVILFGVLAFRKKWLDAGGAVAAALLGVVLWVAGGMVVVIPVLLFFFSGSLLGKLPRKAISDAKHNKPRDWAQVAANGGLGGVLIMADTFFPSHTLLMAYFVSVAVCTADTWSSEIGQWAGGKVVDIVRCTPLQAGLSGGISWQGTVGGLMGATAIGLACYWMAEFNGTQVAIIIAFGFTGMLADSVLGSIFQGRFLLANGTLTEDRSLANGKAPQKGWRWMTNDTVNWLSNLLMVAAYLIFCW